MEKITDLIGHSIAEWEESFDKRRYMHLDEISLHSRVVVGAKGTVLINNEVINVKWLWDGRCWWGNVRLSQFDVKFN